MAWGYEKSFTIEHDDTVRKRIDCKDCYYYEKDDKSCMKRPLYLPVDGYNSWRNCSYFELDSSTSNYDSKRVQYEEIKRRNKQKLNTKTNKKGTLVSMQKSVNQTKSITSQNQNTVTKVLAHVGNDILTKGFNVLVINGKYPKKLLTKYIDVTLNNGKQIKVQVGFDLMNKKAYINGKVYTKEAVLKVIEKIS